MSDLLEFDIDNLSEGLALELKSAQGKNGEGEVSKDFLRTYSAMANTNGGITIFGIDNDRNILGIKNPDKVLKQLWDTLNNRDRVSANVLLERDVRIQQIGDLNVIVIKIPRSRRCDRPVYLGQNPLLGTYKRNHEGDYKATASEVKRMLSEQTEESRDSQVLGKFGIPDIVSDTLKAYRQRFTVSKPDHPWNALDDKDFLERIGAWRTDRDSGESGLTIAGLLAFGDFNSIREVFPRYFVDFQQRPEAKADKRWIDRIEPDGSWSGNLYDFYRKVIQKLYENLKVPFLVDLEGVRQGDTPVHESLREALVNCLIHADYSGSVSVLVVKRPDMFGFRNPGSMRIPSSLAIKGGVSDCRNSTLQTIFRLTGLGEQAGSGVPKIFESWSGQHWRLPVIKEQLSPPEQTVFELRMVSLLPEDTLRNLEDRYGERFSTLPELERLALATVEIEESVSHGRLKEMWRGHSQEISSALARLVREKFLDSSGAARGTYYFFPGQDPANIDNNETFPGSEHSRTSSEQFQARSEHLRSQDVNSNSGELWKRAVELGKLVKSSKKMKRQTVTDIVLKICNLGYVNLETLSDLTGRNPDTLRVHYLSPLLKEHRLELKYPNRNHPRQAYKTSRKALPDKYK